MALAVVVATLLATAAHADLDPRAIWSSPESERTYRAVWADWDGDRDLDLAVVAGSGAINGPARVYRNDGGSLVVAWTSAEVEDSRDAAWGVMRCSSAMAPLAQRSRCRSICYSVRGVIALSETASSTIRARITTCGEPMEPLLARRRSSTSFNPRACRPLAP